MDKREYFGVLTSPFATEREKERVRKKIEKRCEYEYEKSRTKEVKIYLSFVDRENFSFLMPVEGFISMGLEEEEVSLFIEDRLEKRGTYKNIKKYIENIKKQYNDTAVFADEKMRIFHPSMAEELFKIKLPSWLEYLSGPCSRKAMINKNGIEKINFSCYHGLFLSVDNSGAKLKISKFAVKDVLSAIALSAGLLYMEKPYQSISGLRYGYYVFEEEQKYNIRKKVRTKKISKDSFYRVVKETEKSIWVEPVSFDVNKYLKGFTDFIERSKSRDFDSIKSVYTSIIGR